MNICFLPLMTIPLSLTLVLICSGLCQALLLEHDLLLLEDLGHFPHQALKALLVHLVGIC